MQAILGRRILAAIRTNKLDVYVAPDESRFERYEIVVEIRGVAVARVSCLKEEQAPSFRIFSTADINTVSLEASRGGNESFIMFCDNRDDAVEVHEVLTAMLNASIETPQQCECVEPHCRRLIQSDVWRSSTEN